MESLDLCSTRELEDLIIEAFYANVIHGQLDQINKQVSICWQSNSCKTSMTDTSYCSRCASSQLSFHDITTSL